MFTGKKYYYMKKKTLALTTGSPTAKRGSDRECLRYLHTCQIGAGRIDGRTRKFLTSIFLRATDLGLVLTMCMGVHDSPREIGSRSMAM
jgi:hypothetical protein